MLYKVTYTRALGTQHHLLSGRLGIWRGYRAVPHFPSERKSVSSPRHAGGSASTARQRLAARRVAEVPGVGAERVTPSLCCSPHRLYPPPARAPPLPPALSCRLPRCSWSKKRFPEQTAENS